MALKNIRKLTLLLLVLVMPVFTTGCGRLLGALLGGGGGGGPLLGAGSLGNGGGAGIGGTGLAGLRNAGNRGGTSGNGLTGGSGLTGGTGAIDDRTPGPLAGLGNPPADEPLVDSTTQPLDDSCTT